RAVQRDREPDLTRLLGEHANLRRKSAGGDRDVPRAEPDSPRGIDDVDGTDEVREIRQRLAHSHEDKVAHALAGETLGLDDLADDFAGREIAREAIQPARAKLAAIGTAYLRAHAKCASIARFAVERGRRRDEDALDEVA